MKTTALLRSATLFVATLGVQLSGYSQLLSLNTGVAANGSGPLAYNSVEQNYSVYYSAALLGNPSVNATPWHAIAAPRTGDWMASPANAQWVSPISAADLAAGNFVPTTSDPVGYFYFTEIAGFTGTFSGGFTSDNPSALFINGNFVAGTPGWATGTDQHDYLQLWNVNFTVNQGDSIEWILDNVPGSPSNPAGLLVSGTVTPAPEPATFVFLGLGLSAMAILRRRQRFNA
jgi:hypothetical protein